MKKLFCTFIFHFLVLQLFAQNSEDGLWTFINENGIVVTGKRQIIPQKFKTLKLNITAVKLALEAAPHENRVLIAQSPCIITLPLPNGSFERFRVIYSPIMAPELERFYSDIKTFSIKGIDNPHAVGKMDMNEFGFHGMVFSPEGDYFIDPFCLGNTTNYISYYTHHFVKSPADIIPEAGLIADTDQEKKPSSTAGPETGYKIAQPPAACVGAVLKTYRLAVACTGEYAAAATGQTSPSVAQTLAKIVTSVNRVNGVYEKELSVRLSLVATNTLIVFTSGTSDPFNGNNNANTLINESQTVITNNIGSSNYDVGHTFSTGGGGLANLGCVCNNSSKARGITGSGNPVGDPYDIDYVAHEMGHQFGAEHTFNSNTGSCLGNRSAANSVEPGSGVTIMAYAGLCGANNLSTNSIPYFHAISYDQIVNFTQSSLGSCAVTNSTGNQPPSVNSTNGITVPVSTPFILTGTATDPDGDPLTYSWEQTDPGTSSGNWNSGNRPYFRSYTPVSSSTRLFPNSTVVASGNYTGTKGEYLPTSAQLLNFRLTARDNKAGGGGVCYSNVAVTVDGAGPFEVTNPDATGISWVSGSTQNITWDVNGTNFPPIAADSVRILISYNSGNTYTTLVGSTPNDGIHTMASPTVANTITTCRIRIEAKGHVFYDIGDNNFQIIANGDGVGVNETSGSNLLGLRAWPNPAGEELNIELGNLNNRYATEIYVKDVLGRKVMVLNFESLSFLKNKLNVSFLNQGVYFISAVNNGNYSVVRFVKQ